MNAIGCKLIPAVFSCILLVSPLAQAYSQSLNESGTPADYKFGVGDVIRITVHGEDDLNLESRIEESGKIEYPFLGTIRVASMTVHTLESHIENGLKGDYLIEPDVQVSVVQYRPFYINGEVRNPGSYPFQPGLTVQKAAAIAGGFTRLASTNRIVLKRENSGEEYAAELDTRLNPGDTIIIKESFF